MWKVEIESAKIEERSVVSAKTGKQYRMLEQQGWMYGFDRDGQPHRHPQKVILTLDDDQAGPYHPGLYMVHPSSVYLGRYHRAEIRVRLMSVADFEAWFRATFAKAGASSVAGPVNTARSA